MIYVLSGSVTKVAGVIRVSYPANSTLVVKGTSSGKQFAKDTNTTSSAKAYIFLAPIGNASYTLTATNSAGKTVSKQVYVAKGQVQSVTLAYELVLFDGADNNAVTGGWKKAVGVSLNSNPIVSNAAISNNKLIYSYSDYAYGSLLTVNPVDISAYTTLHIDCTITGLFQYVQVCGAATKAIDALIKQFSDMAASFDAKKTFSAGTYTGSNAMAIDIATLSGAYYIGFGFYCGNAANISVNKLWLS